MANIPVPGAGGSYGTTEAEVVSYITSQWGAAKAAQFKTWYAAALKKDPTLTPSQGGADWIVAEGLATGIGNVGTFVGSSVPTAAAGAAASTASKFPTLTGINAIGAFFNALGSANTWIRVSKVIVGGLLLVIGLVHITGAGGTVASAARKVPVPI